LPGWDFEVDEVSMGVYRVIARDASGRTIEKSGTDPDSLIEECKAEARRLIKAPD